MNAAFTPGPWYRGIGDRLPHGVLDPKTHRTIATCNGDLPIGQNYIIQNEAEREANACLIAAAPELYDALRALRSALSSGVEVTQNTIPQVDAALAKARGEQVSA